VITSRTNGRAGWWKSPCPDLARAWGGQLPRATRHVSYLEEARRRVQSRNQMRVQRINTAAERMQTAVIQGRENGRPGPSLESQVHEIVSRAQEQRAEAKNDFTRNRNHWLNEARDRGSNNPERDMFIRQRERMVQIDRDEHRHIRQAFQKHGKTLPEKQKQTLVRDVHHVMG